MMVCYGRFIFWLVADGAFFDSFACVWIDSGGNKWRHGDRRRKFCTILFHYLMYCNLRVIGPLHKMCGILQFSEGWLVLLVFSSRLTRRPRLRSTSCSFNFVVALRQSTFTKKPSYFDSPWRHTKSRNSVHAQELECAPWAKGILSHMQDFRIFWEKKTSFGIISA